ncbi:spore cortex biosynthesis protein YabQ [Natribacillus halophilus]|uniref:Spore cortex biosynthesis protein YabQ n=1 Tax=Natribacillus halophilus TaxID=549003 RepID=A0A1G8RI45_9BACI|nr:spore cortex biosynthesis protein YabQ [Natribacillus halophilus]SDJ16734.1 spore cortex biosynthesis protein YabQ [Natribacillus halophilus]
MTLDVQFQTFFAMMIAGAAIAAQLDVYHRCLPQAARSKWRQAFGDLCFWIVQAILVFVVLFQMNDGDLRFYIFLSIILGFFTYWQTVRPLFLRVLEVVIKVVNTIYAMILRIFYLFLWTPVVWLYKGTRQVLMIIYQSIRWVLYQVAYLLGRPLYLGVGGPRAVSFVKRWWSRLRNWFYRRR